MADKVIPDSHLDLFQKQAFANLATLMPSGQPQVTPVWVDYDGRYVVINTAEGRQKDKNMQHDGRVSLSIMDPDNPYRYLEVRGDVERIEPDPAASFFRRIANRYSGDEPPPDAPPRGEAPSDAPDWVVIVVRPTGFSKH